MKPKLICIGNGMAGMRTIEELLTLAPDQYDITVFGSEPHGNYNRILLSPVLAGEKTFKDIIINDHDWYEERNITLEAGITVTHIDPANNQIITQHNEIHQYDQLLLATGSNPFIIPIPGKDLKGVVTFRDIQDVNTMLATAHSGKRHAVIIGGGLLGLEAAYGLLKQGMDVTVIHLLDTLMERQLDKPAASLLKNTLTQRGLKFAMEAQTAEILGTNGEVSGIQFKDGSTMPADLIVMAVGIRPNITLAQQSGIHCERGIVVNDYMQTSHPNIYAVGECVQHRGVTYGLVAPLWEQARVCCHQLAQTQENHTYTGTITATRLKVTGIEVFSAGDFIGDANSESIIFQDPAMGIYKKIVLKDNRIIGAVMYGDANDGGWYFDLLKQGKDISNIRERLLFGQAIAEADSATDPAAKIAAMSDNHEVCGCNGVCKGKIITAIREKNLTTLDEVRTHTKASGSCGSCTSLVEQILIATLGESYQKTNTVKPLCKCTTHSHDEIQAAIRAQHLTSIPAVMKALNWKTPDGCHICRPALNYYLLAAFPAEYQDDQQSRFINERVHANIQKDGTYSVVPRIWGGVTNPQELRAIADVADKYEIPCVKITGGQRIDLLGVKKEDLPHVWRDLNNAGMVSGHAYGKSLRTVKTCVGSEWCRFGTQNSTAMGIELERMTWGSWTPHKFKMAVSGCPRNCAEATIKDFGVIAVESGWELHVGGNGGIKVRACDFLCKVNTEAEVLEYCGAFMQLYREEGHYLERTAPWVERVGLDYIKEKIVENAALRAELYARFLDSQQFAQKDPWAERAAGVDKHEFVALNAVN